ncbi:MAG: hypothetical protein ACE5FJ_00730 [Gemmatimonadales bacterium]
MELPFGALCSTCRTEIDRKAVRIARTVALISTMAVGLYAHLSLPESETARTVGAVAVVLWFALSYTAVVRAARLLLK